MHEAEADEQVDAHWFHLTTRIKSGVLDEHLHAIREAEWRRTPPRAAVLKAIHRRHQKLEDSADADSNTVAEADADADTED